MKRIFIAHTPFHVFMSEMIVRGTPKELSAENTILLELDRNYRHVDRRLWSRIEYLELAGGGTLGRQRYAVIERNMTLVRELVGNERRTCVLMSDIAWPMNNRVFFDRHVRHVAQYGLFSDGVGTYTSPRVTRSLFLRGVVKQLNGLLGCGARYHNYWGTQLGLDRAEVCCVYGPNAGLIRCEPQKRREVFLEAFLESARFDSQKCLFLDQPYWRHMNDFSWNAIRNNSLRFIASLGLREYYYKNHPFGRPEDALYYETRGFTVIDSDKCAEQVAPDSGCGVIVSYCSSALFHLKCMYGDRLRCIALFPRSVSMANGFNDDNTDEIIELFRQVGVEIVGRSEG
jgi:hypothetical protein